MEKNKKYLIAGAGLVVLFVVAMLLFSSQKIVDIKNEKHLGQQVKVSGTVTNVIKIGQISGYKIADKNGDEIAVSSKALPQKGEKVMVKGTLMREIVVGYYIQTKD